LGGAWLEDQESFHWMLRGRLWNYELDWIAQDFAFLLGFDISCVKPSGSIIICYLFYYHSEIVHLKGKRVPLYAMKAL
jgi:hypothetical protein